MLSNQIYESPKRMLLDTVGPCDFAFIGIRDSPARSAVHRRCGSTWSVFINGRVGYNAYWYTHTHTGEVLVGSTFACQPLGKGMAVLGHYASSRMDPHGGTFENATAGMVWSNCA